MKSDNNGFFTTRDLVAATYIAYNGIKFASDYDQDSRCWLFQEPEKCRELNLKLRNGEAAVEVLRYESIRRNLLGMTRNVGRGENGSHVDENS
jgi:hypothetical protein